MIYYGNDSGHVDEINNSNNLCHLFTLIKKNKCDTKLLFNENMLITKYKFPYNSLIKLEEGNLYSLEHYIPEPIYQYNLNNLVKCDEPFKDKLMRYEYNLDRVLIPLKLAQEIETCTNSHISDDDMFDFYKDNGLSNNSKIDEEEIDKKVNFYMSKIKKWNQTSKILDKYIELLELDSENIKFFQEYKRSIGKKLLKYNGELYILIKQISE